MKPILLISLYQVEALGLRSLHAALRNAGFPARLVFFKQWSWKERPLYTERERDLLIRELIDAGPSIIGVSVWSFFFRQAVDLTAAIRAALPDVPVIWGGCHPTLMPEACIPHCDGLVIGEGEKPLMELARGVGTESFFKVPGTWMRRGHEVIRNGAGALNDPGTLLPPVLMNEDTCLVEGDRLIPGDPWLPAIRQGTYTFMASRGCPYHCTYCGNHALIRAQGHAVSDYLRWRPVEDVIRELRDVRDRFDVKRFVSLDEVFFLDREWIRRFADRYADEIGLPLQCQVHPTQVNAEVMDLFKRMNIRTLSIGVESGSEKTRVEVYNRRTPDDMLVEKARLLHEAGVLVSYDLIFGNPLEDADALRQTLNLLLRFPRPFRLNLYKLQLLPGTDLTERLVREGHALPKDVQGAPDGVAGKFDLAGYERASASPMDQYLVNLVFLISSTLVVERGAWRWAWSPVPAWVIRLLMRHPVLGLNRFGWLIRKHRAFWNWLGK